MKKLFVILLLIVPSYAMAQDVAKTVKPINTPATMTVANGSLTTPKADENTKPIIIPNAKKQEWAILSLQLENAKLKAEAAVPAEVKKAIKDANDGLDAFWKSIGINPTEIPTKWNVSDGQNGDIILTPKKIEEKAKTP